MYTPNGRFLTDRSICIENKDEIYSRGTYRERWNAASIIFGIKQIMKEHGNIGEVHIQFTSRKRRQLAKDSKKWNLQNPLFNELFPEDRLPVVKEVEEHKEEPLPPKNKKDGKMKSFFKSLLCFGTCKNKVETKK